ncbi:MAG: alpha/beta hydrolase [Ilumatobacter sp.]|nr:alpha/beta hydrolase [Ilumatobacter sp.]
MLRLDSVDDASIAVHELAGDASLPPLLISHATGFHAHCYRPVARALGDRFHVWALDHRGHGFSTVPPEWRVDWKPFGVDTALVAEHIAPDGGLVGVGHSMGGATLLMAAHADPGRFDHLVLFEPIAFPGTDYDPDPSEELPIAAGARRRRRRFPTRQAAVDNYAAKPPLALMLPEVLADYVEYGFADTTDDEGEPAIELRCTPEFEAAVFMTGGGNGVWDLLPEIETPCTIVSGVVSETEPSRVSEPLAERLPNARYVRFDDQTHFGPFSHPAEFAALV